MPTIDVLSKIIHENGGKLFLAHPYKYVKKLNVLDILDMCSSFVDGIEICNEPKNEYEVKYLYEYAKKNNLLVCAGSDFHSSESSNLFVNYLSEEMENDIISWISQVPGKIKIIKK